jgi:hypothetical protein
VLVAPQSWPGPIPQVAQRLGKSGATPPTRGRRSDATVAPASFY